MRDALKNCGIKALTVSIQTLCGPRKPDLLCENAGKYPIEAKFTERKLVDAIAKIQNDYLKFYKTLGIKGGFALLYPEELSQPMPLDIVKELALKFRFKVIASIEYVVKSLRDAATGAYILVNQLLFYHVLSRVKPDLFPEIDTNKLSYPLDLKPYLERVLDLNYQTIFSYDVLSRISTSFSDVIKTLIIQR